MTTVSDRCRAALDAAQASTLNIWRWLDADGALQSAAESDARLARSAGRALEGQLVAVKANIAVAGWPHDGGLRTRRSQRAAVDSIVVRRLREAGAVLLGLTQMDEAALGAAGSSIDGPIQHPMREGWSVGGSSGGSAAALAAGHCDAALGTDTIGSIRIPAALCGISGLKPTPGLVSLEGVLPLDSRFDHVGPMSRSAAALWPLLCCLRGLPATPLADPEGILAGRRVGVLEGLESLGCAGTVLEAYAESIAKLRDAGAVLRSIDVQQFDLSRVRRAVFSLCERTLALEHAAQRAADPEGYSVSMHAMLDYGAGLCEADCQRFEQRVAAFRESWTACVADLDACVTPSAPVTSFPHALPPPTNIADLTVIATAAGWPAVSVPCALTAGALPVGLQILAPPGQDARVCALGIRLAAGSSAA
ncbi:MAG: amidase [Sinobacteraceae bacterium]|nr:amidase [Nevskiaceae bacterium]